MLLTLRPLALHNVGPALPVDRPPTIKLNREVEIMRGTSIGYHTRLYLNNSIKVCGGSFGGAVDQYTIERLVNAHFDVVVKPSGTAVFVDRERREVRLYISVDAGGTGKGKAALALHRKAQDVRREQEREKEIEIEALLANLSTDEIINRLK